MASKKHLKLICIKLESYLERLQELIVLHVPELTLKILTIIWFIVPTAFRFGVTFAEKRGIFHQPKHHNLIFKEKMTKFHRQWSKMKQTSILI